MVKIDIKLICLVFKVSRLVLVHSAVIVKLNYKRNEHQYKE